MKKRENNKFLRFLKFIYLKVFRINDSPQKIAQGFALGVFLGLIPGTGILAALCCAFILRVNRASALLGALLTNGWLTIVTFLLSIKAGSAIMNLKWQEVYRQFIEFIKNFSFAGLFKISFLKIVLPIVIGYCIVGLALAIIAYLVSLFLAIKIKNARKSRINLPG